MKQKKPQEDPKSDFEKNVETQLKALKATFSFKSPKEVIFNTLVQLWKKKHSAPEMQEIYDALPNYKRETIRKLLHDMKCEHRLLHPHKSIWLPIVKITGLDMEGYKPN